MKQLVRYSRGRLDYTGRLDRGRFVTWSESPPGESVVATLASQRRFALFGSFRAARRDLWRQLRAAAGSKTIALLLQRELNAYTSRIGLLAHARDLPRVGIGLRRLIVVPRFFANAVIHRRIDAALATEPVFATGNGRESLRDHFLFGLLDGIDAAIANARPSLRAPVPVGREWIIVGVNDRFEWRAPGLSPTWTGHFYLLELTQEPLTRAVRKAAAKGLEELESSIPSLSRLHRDEILRQAGSSAEQLLRSA